MIWQEVFFEEDLFWAKLPKTKASINDAFAKIL